VNFSEQPLSTQWAALKFRGEKLAEVWFKPEGEPFGLLFRIPETSFQLPGIGQRLTAEHLLKAVGITTEEVESWHAEGVFPSAVDPSDPQLTGPLPQPPADASHLEIRVRLKRPPEAVASKESTEPESAGPTLQELDARWKTIMGLEVMMDSQRLSMETLRGELEGLLRRALSPEERLHALAADVAQYNKAKSRVHYALPKAKEFIHRAIWAKATAEWKRLVELFKDPAAAQLSPSQMDKVREELDVLRKDRQILSAQGVTVSQECKTIAAEVQGTLRQLQSNAAGRALKKKGATGAKRKSF
jgi:hypothetical protein